MKQTQQQFHAQFHPLAPASKLPGQGNLRILTARQAANDDADGYTLLETVVVLGVVLVGTAAVIGGYSKIQKQREQATQAQNTREIASRVLRFKADRSNFAGLDTATALTNKMLPERMLLADGTIKPLWGGVQINSYGAAADSVAITYPQVPKANCVAFVSGEGRGFSSILINGEAISQNYGRINQGMANELCNAQATAKVDLIMGAAGTSNISGATTLCAPAPTVTEDAGCPEGQAGEFIRTRDFICAAGQQYGPPMATPWVTLSNTCAPICVAPPPGASYPEIQTFKCPPGQFVRNTNTDTRQIARQLREVYSCPAYTGPHSTAIEQVSGWGSWPTTGVSNWPMSQTEMNAQCVPQCTTAGLPAIVETTPQSTTFTCPTGTLHNSVSGWPQTAPQNRTRYTNAAYFCDTKGSDVRTEYSYTYTPYLPAYTVQASCSPICTAPPSKTTVTPQSQPMSCPSGQAVASGATGFTQARNQTVITDYACSNPIGVAIPTDRPATYSAWTPSIGSVCAPICTVPQSTSTATSGGQIGNCPAGMVTPTGASAFDQSRTGSIIRTWKCPAPTGPATWTESTEWNAWSPLDANAAGCAPKCVPPSPASMDTPESQTTSCNTGRVTPAGNATFTQGRIRTNVTDFACSAPNGSVVPAARPATFTNWGPTESEACAPKCVARAPTTRAATRQNQTVSCPSGDVTISSGSETFGQYRDGTITTNYKCPAPTGNDVGTDDAPVWGVWMPLASQVCAPKCVAPATLVEDVSETGAGYCSPGDVTPTGAASFARTRTGKKTTTYTCPSFTGNYTTNPSTFEWQAWTPTASGAGCAPKCTAPAPTSVKTTENYTESCKTGRLTPSGAATFGQTRVKDIITDYRCSAPNGYVISTPKAATYTPWTPTEASACAPICTAPPPSTRAATPQNQTGTCAPGEVSISTGDPTFPQTRSGTITTNYSCPGPTGPYTPTDAPTAWNAWTPTASTACGTKCVAPPTKTEAVTDTQPMSCPTGQVTIAAGAASFTQTRTGTKTTTYSCSAYTGPYTTNPSTYDWNAWGPTVQSTCAPKCNAPAKTDTPESQYKACDTGRVTPSGAVGFTQTRTWTRTWTCPSPTGASTFTDTYSAWTPLESNACAPKCVAPSQKIESVSENGSGSCSPGQVTPSGSATFPTTRTGTRYTTYICPAPVGNYTVFNVSDAWNAWTPTAWAAGCAPICTAPPPAPRPASENRSVPCPSGQTTLNGRAVRKDVRTGTTTTNYACSAPNGTVVVSGTSTAWNAWAPATSNDVCAPICTVPATEYRFCNYDGNAWCDDGWWAYYSETVNQTGSCAPGQQLNSAPWGRTTWTETREHYYYTRESRDWYCTAPTGSAVATPWVSYDHSWYYSSPWAGSLASQCAPNCSAPSPYTEGQWQYPTGYCPGGYVTAGGATTFAQSQYGVRTVTYGCPSPVGAYAVWGDSTAWNPASPTWDQVCGYQRCNPATVPAPWNEYFDNTWFQQAANCPAGYGGGRIVQNWYRPKYRQVSYSCANGLWADPVTHYSGAWEGGNIYYNDASNTCLPCRAPGTEVWVEHDYSGEACGKWGMGWREIQRHRNNTRSVSYACATNTDINTVSWASGWSYGGWIVDYIGPCYQDGIIP